MTHDKTTKLIHVGTISGAHGIKGEVKIRSFTSNPRAIADYQPLYDAKQTREYRIAIVGTSKDHLIARIEGIIDRNQAELLRQVELYAPRDRIPTPTDEDEILLEDLIGLTVKLTDGVVYGSITGFMNYGAGDILEITPTDSKKPELYSFSYANFPEIFINNGYLIFQPPEVLNAANSQNKDTD